MTTIAERHALRHAASQAIYHGTGSRIRGYTDEDTTAKPIIEKRDEEDSEDYGGNWTKDPGALMWAGCGGMIILCLILFLLFYFRHQIAPGLF